MFKVVANTLQCKELLGVPPGTQVHLVLDAIVEASEESEEGFQQVTLDVKGVHVCEEVV